ncbi:DUF736 family protein [Rhizobium sp. MHM7A]|uniref:DUF736 domain-containing protein n=1 Tax=Rhizobium sp. MHM7A TaxID=2583233 RepID=UPI0011075630|nr:DUF736 family protein [Rhizobium sp. MHM7A]TLX16199.1 DUF736 domain-containing protein [Rhizobium sp. MHM7A]
MGTLGKLKKTGVTYKGLIEGITFGPVPVVISPIAKANPEAPDYRVYRGQSEVGAAWKKRTQEGNRYLIVTLDDPAFPASIKCRLVPDGEEHTLYWTRP